MTTLKSTLKPTPEQLRCAEAFAARIRVRFGARVMAVVQYPWVREDFEGKDEEHYVELVVVMEDYSSDRDEEVVFDISTEMNIRKEFGVTLFPQVYDSRHFREHALEPWWEPSSVVSEGRVIYDSGFIDDLRKRQYATGGANDGR